MLTSRDVLLMLESFCLPFLYLLQTGGSICFSRQMKTRANTEIIHHHSFNIYLSKKDTFVSNSSMPSDRR